MAIEATSAAPRRAGQRPSRRPFASAAATGLVAFAAMMAGPALAGDEPISAVVRDSTATLVRGSDLGIICYVLDPAPNDPTEFPISLSIRDAAALPDQLVLPGTQIYAFPFSNGPVTGCFDAPQATVTDMFANPAAYHLWATQCYLLLGCFYSSSPFAFGSVVPTPGASPSDGPASPSLAPNAPSGLLPDTAVAAP